MFKIYGMELKNCAPRKGWAKLVESVYSVLRHVDNDPVFNGAQRSGPTDAPNPDPKPVDMSLFRAFIGQEIARFNANRDTRAMGIKKGENRDEAFERISKGRIYRPVTPLIHRSVRAYFKLVLVSQVGQVRFDGGTWGDETTQTGMLRHAGKQVLVGFDPQNYSAPAMVYGWEDPKWKGKLLFDALPNVEKARHNDETSRRRAITEDRRTKAGTAKYVPTDLAERVEGWRAEVMANAGQAPLPVKPIVVQLDLRGPLSPAPALHQPNEPSQAAKLLALIRAEQNDPNRAASGGNR
ncbi:MAG: hypothetical protein B7Y02_00530 [Rhodobacterales bacterium 17-64-5]|nr:MAG: hypothetical protein B7Y02_00530 [Rhodobacterales bacterium 17-64-5]